MMKTTRQNFEEFRIRGPGVDLCLGRRTLLMGILNVTPDSFSDGGLFLDPGKAVRRAETLAAEGADLIDIGGESSRPGADPVSEEEEIRRVVPVIERLSKSLSIPISIDTTKAVVARRALDAGAGLINDISAFRFDADMAPLAVEKNVPVILMHMQGRPGNMQAQPVYTDVVREIGDFFRERLKIAKQAGVSLNRIVLDPGMGFGKTVEHNLQILSRLDEFLALGRPILIGPSQKSFIGHLLDLPVGERMEGTAAAVVAGVLHGASIVRVHDVRVMARAVRVAEAIRDAGRD